MLEEQEVWKREDDFDRIEIIAEMHAQRLHAGFDSESIYIGLYNSRWLPTPETNTLKTNVEVERLRLDFSF